MSCTFCHTSAPALNATGKKLKDSGFNYASIAPAPAVTAFNIPATSTSLTVSITTFTATDNVPLTGYMVTESSTPPSASGTGWSVTPPTSYAFATAGAKTLYGWAKDAANIVSTSLKSASTTISLPPAADTIPPTVNSFTIPATSSSLTIPISSFSATDNVGTIGYMVTESASKPSPSASGWLTSPPSNHTFATTGSKTLYAWAKDAVSNVSASKSSSVSITLPTPPPPSSSEDLNVWVGKWFKLTTRYKGFNVGDSGMSNGGGTITGYLKIWNWDPANKVLQADGYEQDTSGQWFSEPFNLNYLGGSNQDFLCWSQVTGDISTGFTARIKGNMKKVTSKTGQSTEQQQQDLVGATFKTMGGYYIEMSNESGSSGNYAGSITITGSLIPESKVPVPSNTWVH